MVISILINMREEGRESKTVWRLWECADGGGALSLSARSLSNMRGLLSELAQQSVIYSSLTDQIRLSTYHSTPVLLLKNPTQDNDMAQLNCYMIGW